MEEDDIGYSYISFVPKISSKSKKDKNLKNSKEDEKLRSIELIWIKPKFY